MSVLMMLAYRSLWSRRGTVVLTVLSVATSFALLVSVERLREATRSSFENTISGTDFLVGARGSGVQLLLYSVFRIGEPVRELTWESYEAISEHPEVEWSVPLGLGDSARGYRVVGTTPAYFKYYRYGRNESLQLGSGRTFDEHDEAVLGSEVARSLGWSLGTRFPVQHGVDEDARAHESAEFEVVGILAPTGTPVDRSVHVTLGGLAEVHHGAGDVDHPGHEESAHDSGHEESAHDSGHEESAHDSGHEESAHEEHSDELSTVSVVLVGLRSKIGLFRMRSWIDDFAAEPLMAVMPGRAFQQLWSTVSVVHATLRIIGVLVTLAGIIALSAMLLATVNERRREMALLRSIGASPSNIGCLVVGEALLVALTSVAVALAGVFCMELLGHAVLATALGLRITPTPITWVDVRWTAAFLATAIVVALIPAAISYRRSLSDGLLVGT